MDGFPPTFGRAETSISFLIFVVYSANARKESTLPVINKSGGNSASGWHPYYAVARARSQTLAFWTSPEEIRNIRTKLYT